MSRPRRYLPQAKSWNTDRPACARIEATTKGLDIRFVVTSIEAGSPEHIYETLYCARGQAENLIKLHKAQLASDRTSCRSPLANQMRLILHTAVCGRPRGCKQNLSSAMGMWSGADVCPASKLRRARAAGPYGSLRTGSITPTRAQIRSAVCWFARPRLLDRSPIILR
jgi:hypothetical protein